MVSHLLKFLFKLLRILKVVVPKTLQELSLRNAFFDFQPVVEHLLLGLKH